MPELGVACGHCGGAVEMVTCDEVRGTGHEWVLYSRCDGECNRVHIIESGCPQCARADHPDRAA